jgi:hypothetical protein
MRRVPVGPAASARWTDRCVPDDLADAGGDTDQNDCAGASLSEGLERTRPFRYRKRSNSSTKITTAAR